MGSGQEPSALHPHLVLGKSVSRALMMAICHILYLGKAFQAALTSIHTLATFTYSRPKKKKLKT